MSSATFTEQDWLSINTIRLLSADMVQKANSGHPGAPMGCAPLAHVLFSRHFRCNPKNSAWPNRDRFVLSNGHACALQYSLLHLLGYKISLEDIKQFRQLNSVTPGHPEAELTDGVEVTTGPLGQGFANAVGIAIGEAHLAATFNRDGFNIIDSHTYVIAGDGCLQEGVASEAASLAGHLKLGKLIVFYDDNHIQIDGDTALAFSEDVIARFKAYGWHTLIVDDGDKDLDSIHRAVEIAKSETSKPTLIKVRTTIGYGAKRQGTEKVHGSPLGAEDIVEVKKAFNFDPEKHFFIPDQVKDDYGHIRDRGAKYENEWNELFDKYKQQHPELGAELQRRIKGQLPTNWRDHLPTYTPEHAAVATRKLSEAVLNKIADVVPELMGGSADLTGSNLTRWKTAVEFQSDDSELGNYKGRYIRYGVREHAMTAIVNGLGAYGAIIPFGATFLNFVGYAWGAMRLSALSGIRSLCIATHDSIGLGEDGPTHQPIEILPLLRATPNLNAFRPADGNEVSAAYAIALESPHTPTVLSLTRQNVPHLRGSSIEKASLGGYVLQDSNDPLKVILVGTGSEVSICVDAAKLLEEAGIATRVVSLPCWEVFDAQKEEYRVSVFPAGVPVISVEAASIFGWQKFSHVQIGLTTFGSCGPYKEVYKHFGLTPEHVSAKAKEVVEFYKTEPVSHLMKKPF